ncbi:MAG: 3-oxoadipyl-CoA thiolase, partial [Acidobacteria bacterium]
GQTVNRLCGSGLQALNSAAQAIWGGQGDLFVAGGVESMSRAPVVMLKAEQAFPRGVPDMADSTLGWRFPHPDLVADGHTASLGETAENVAERRGVSRQDQDEFALLSQQKAGRAMQEGRLAEEIVPTPVPARKGEAVTVEQDEHPRPGTTREALAKLRPAFAKDGSVTAGNSSGINDGAAMLLVTSAERARDLGLEPLARVVSTAVAGVRPDEMGLGPIPASRKALARAGLGVDDMQIVELNEAFVSQAIASLEDLGIDWHDEARVNPNGGAIALGHPIGCTGARITVTLIHEMLKRKARRGLATLCVSGGMGMAMALETIA